MIARVLTILALLVLLAIGAAVLVIGAPVYVLMGRR